MAAKAVPTKVLTMEEVAAHFAKQPSAPRYLREYLAQLQLQPDDSSDPRHLIASALELLSKTATTTLTSADAVFKSSRDVLEQLASSRKKLHVSRLKPVQKSPLIFGAEWRYTLNGSVNKLPIDEMFLLELALMQTRSSPVVFSVMVDAATGNKFVARGATRQEGSTMAIYVDMTWNMSILHHSTRSEGSTMLERVPMIEPVYQYSLDRGETWTSFTKPDSNFMDQEAFRSRWKRQVHIGGTEHEPRVPIAKMKPRFTLNMDNGTVRFYDHEKNVARNAYVRRAGGKSNSAQHSFIWGLGKQLVNSVARASIPRGAADFFQIETKNKRSKAASMAASRAKFDHCISNSVSFVGEGKSVSFLKCSCGESRHDCMASWDLMRKLQVHFASCSMRRRETDPICGICTYSVTMMLDHAKTCKVEGGCSEVCSRYRKDILKESTMEAWQKDTSTNSSCSIIDAPRGGGDWNLVAERVHMTMPLAVIERVQKVFNTSHHRCFELEKSMRRGMENEQLLFHGTSLTPLEMIYTGSGFDPQKSKTGAYYGSGVYFSDNAMYSNKYAHQLSDGRTRQLFLSKVLLGETWSFGTERRPDLCAAPLKTNRTEAYGSVHGIIPKDSASLFVVYKGSQTYCEYVVSYTLPEEEGK